MLTGTDIPAWVNRLASMSGSIPFFERIVPPEWLTPVALQQSLEEKQKKPSEPVTMNYPVEDAQEALEGHNPNTSKNSGNSKLLHFSIFIIIKYHFSFGYLKWYISKQSAIIKRRFNCVLI